MVSCCLNGYHWREMNVGSKEKEIRAVSMYYFIWVSRHARWFRWYAVAATDGIMPETFLVLLLAAIAKPQ